MDEITTRCFANIKFYSALLLFISFLSSTTASFAGAVGSFVDYDAELGDPAGDDCRSPSKAVGNPINILTGNHYYEKNLYRGGGRFPLDFTVYNNSYVKKAGLIFGEWGYSYGQYVSFDAVSYGSPITVVRADGHREVYLSSSVSPNRYPESKLIWRSSPATQTQPQLATLISQNALATPFGGSESRLQIVYEVSCLRVAGYSNPYQYDCSERGYDGFVYHTKEGNTETYKVIPRFQDFSRNPSGLMLSDKAAYLTEIKSPYGETQKITREQDYSAGGNLYTRLVNANVKDDYGINY